MPLFPRAPRMTQHRLLVLCTGNICRSPMAEAWFRRELGHRAVVESAGLGALVGKPADPMAIDVARENGLDLTSHVARQITPDMIRHASLVLTMETRQRDQVLKLAPWATGKVWRIAHHMGQDVPDPYRSTREAFGITYHLISQAGRHWLSFAKDA